MTTRKFAIGDEIVVVNADSFGSYENGDKGIVDSFDELWAAIRRPMESSNCWKVVVMTRAGERREWLNEEEMEHAAIVASPLWKELR